MQHTTVLILVESTSPAEVPEAIFKNIKQLIQHFSWYEQLILLMHPHGQTPRLSLPTHSVNVGLFPYVSTPFDAHDFQAWFALQSDEQDYLIVGEAQVALALAQTLNQKFQALSSDQTAWWVEDAVFGTLSELKDKAPHVTTEAVIN